MKPIVIIKTGSTFPFIAEKYGDFEHWMMKGTGASEAEFRTVPVSADPLPDLDNIRGILITGSHDMVTESENLNPAIEKWIPEAVKRRVPLLGICYGHQLLAHVMGGRVRYLDGGKEAGTVPIILTGEGQTDPLFSVMPPEFPGHVSHAQTVAELPPGATRLAFSHRDPHQAFVLNRTAWGVQFHPEFYSDVVKIYIEQNRQHLLDHGQDPDAVLATVKDSPHGGMLLRRFYALTEK